MSRRTLVCGLLLATAPVSIAGQGTSSHARELPAVVISDFQHTGLPFGTRTTVHYTYNKQGQVVLQVEERDTGPTGAVDLRTTTTFVYGSHHHVVSQALERDFFADGVIEDVETTRWIYNSRGLPVESSRTITHRFSAVVEHHRTRFVHDSRGLLIEQIVDSTRDFDPEFEQHAVTTYTYNNRGQLLEAAQRITDDTSPLRLTVVQLYEYDVRGNLVRTRNLNDLNNDGVDSVFITESGFNERRQVVLRVRTSQFSTIGVNDLVERVESTYDARGDLVREIETFDTFDDGAIDRRVETTYTRDVSGRLLSRTRTVDRDGNGTIDETETSEYFY